MKRIIRSDGVNWVRFRSLSAAIRSVGYTDSSAHLVRDAATNGIKWGGFWWYFDTSKEAGNGAVIRNANETAGGANERAPRPPTARFYRAA